MISKANVMTGAAQEVRKGDMRGEEIKKSTQITKQKTEKGVEVKRDQGTVPQKLKEEGVRVRKGVEVKSEVKARNTIKAKRHLIKPRARSENPRKQSLDLVVKLRSEAKAERIAEELAQKVGTMTEPGVKTMQEARKKTQRHEEVAQDPETEKEPQKGPEIKVVEVGEAQNLQTGRSVKAKAKTPPEEKKVALRKRPQRGTAIKRGRLVAVVQTVRGSGGPAKIMQVRTPTQYIVLLKKTAHPTEGAETGRKGGRHRTRKPTRSHAVVKGNLPTQKKQK